MTASLTGRNIVTMELGMSEILLGMIQLGLHNPTT